MHVVKGALGSEQGTQEPVLPRSVSSSHDQGHVGLSRVEGVAVPLISPGAKSAEPHVACGAPHSTGLMGWTQGHGPGAEQGWLLCGRAAGGGHMGARSCWGVPARLLGGPAHALCLRQWTLAIPGQRPPPLVCFGTPGGSHFRQSSLPVVAQGWHRVVILGEPGCRPWWFCIKSSWSPPWGELCLAPTVPPTWCSHSPDPVQGERVLPSPPVFSTSPWPGNPVSRCQ